MQTREQLQAIIDQKTTGPNAATVLRNALKERDSCFARYNELCQLVRQAEDILVYGKEGRPVQETYR